MVQWIIMTKDKPYKLHDMYSSSATVHLICHKYKINQSQLARNLGVTKELVSIWKSSRQEIGLKMYREIVKLYPELEGRICFTGTYKGNKE